MSRKKHFLTFFEFFVIRDFFQLMRTRFFLLFIAKLVLHKRRGEFTGVFIGQFLGDIAENHMSSRGSFPTPFSYKPTGPGPTLKRDMYKPVSRFITLDV